MTTHIEKTTTFVTFSVRVCLPCSIDEAPAEIKSAMASFVETFDEGAKISDISDWEIETTTRMVERDSSDYPDEPWF